MDLFGKFDEREEIKTRESLDEKIKPSILIDESIKLPESMKVIITKTITDYCEKFGITKKITVTDINNDETYDKEKHSQSLGRGASGIIYLDQDQIMNKGENKETSLRNIIFHEMTHAIKGAPDSFTFRKSLLDIQSKDGDKVYGYYGLSFLVQLADKSSTKILVFEESVAEYLTDCMYGSQDDVPYSYRAGTYILKKLLGTSEEKQLKCLLFVQQNDVPGFVGTIIGKERAAVTDEDIFQILKTFNFLWKLGNQLNSNEVYTTCDKVIEVIIALREDIKNSGK